MSPLSIDTLLVRLAPDAVQAAARSTLTGRLGEVKAVPVAGQGDGVGAWEPAMEAFAALLRQFGLRRVQVQLSQHFVQLRLLPWRPEIVNAAELEALARHEFTNAFGSIADDWRLALSDEAPGRSRLAAAMPHPLLHALQSTATQAGARVVGVEPALVAASRAWRPRAAGQSCQWLLQYESSRLAVLVRDGRGHWAWVRHARVDQHWLAGLEQWLQAEAMMSGLPVHPEQVTVHAPALGASAQQTLRALRVGYLHSGWRA